MIEFDVFNRWSGAVQFTAKIDCAKDAPRSVKLGLAVVWAVKTRANLTDANLAGADLAEAYLHGANLAGAYLRGANLAEAYLHGANLAGANLTDANLAGAIGIADCVIDGGLRSDGYRFMLLRDGEDVFVSAGCRHFSLPESRQHWQKTRAGTPLGDETFAILDHMERIARLRGWPVDQKEVAA